MHNNAAGHCDVLGHVAGKLLELRVVRDELLHLLDGVDLGRGLRLLLELVHVPLRVHGVPSQGCEKGIRSELKE